VVIKISVKALKSGSRPQKVSAIRSQLARKLVEEWDFSLTEAGSGEIQVKSGTPYTFTVFVEILLRQVELD